MKKIILIICCFCFFISCSAENEAIENTSGNTEKAIQKNAVKVSPYVDHGYNLSNNVIFIIHGKVPRGDGLLNLKSVFTHPATKNSASKTNVYEAIHSPTINGILLTQPPKFIQSKYNLYDFAKSSSISMFLANHSKFKIRVSCFSDTNYRGAKKSFELNKNTRINFTKTFGKGVFFKSFKLQLL